MKAAVERGCQELTVYEDLLEGSGMTEQEQPLSSIYQLQRRTFETWVHTITAFSSFPDTDVLEK